MPPTLVSMRRADGSSERGKAMSQKNFFTRFSTAVAHAAGRPITFGLAAVSVLVWALSGPLFGFSETWQLVVNTTTTIITFLMVFVLQNTQNRDSEALHAKLDELILVGQAKNAFIGAEHLSEGEIKRLHELVEKAAKRPETADAEQPGGSRRHRKRH